MARINLTMAMAAAQLLLTPAAIRAEKPVRELVPVSLAQIRTRIQPGDVVAFSGKTRISGFIQLFTGSNVSHVAVVLEAPTVTSSGLMIESTSETLLPRKNEPDGVLISKIDERLAEYKGNIWLLPLSEEIRASSDWTRFREFLEEQRGKKYDRWQMVKLINSPLFRVPLLGRLFRNRENFNRLFCSELVSGALRSARVVRGISPSNTTPRQVARLPIYGSAVYQLKGEHVGLAGVGVRFQMKTGLAQGTDLATHRPAEAVAGDIE